MEIIVWIIIIGWLFLVQYMESENKKRRAKNPEKNEAAPWVKRLMEERKQAEIEAIRKYEEAVQFFREQNKTQIEYAERERIRIEKAYKVRPTVAEISKKSFNKGVSENDKDYLDVRIFGDCGEFAFLYVEKEDYKMWSDFIDEDVVPEGMDEDDFDDQIYESQLLLTLFSSIGTAEFGTKNYYIQFEMGEDTEDDDIEFGTIIKDYLGLIGDEDGYVVARYEGASRYLLDGAIGLQTTLKGPLTKEKINFHKTYFKIESNEYNYSDFGIGEMDTKYVYKIIIPVSDLKNFLPSDV